MAAYVPNRGYNGLIEAGAFGLFSRLSCRAGGNMKLNRTTLRTVDILKLVSKKPDGITSVSYTHLTLPTKLEV